MSWDDLLDQLAAEDDPLTRPKAQRVVCIQPGDERKVNRFSEVNAFVCAHGREPDTKARDAAEVTLAASLKGFRSRPADAALLSGYDEFGLLGQKPSEAPPSTLDALLDLSDPLLDDPDPSLFMPLPAVPGQEESGDRAAPDKIAERRRCLTFDVWRPVFARIADEVNRGIRRVSPTGWTTEVEKGHAFITGGHVAVIAEVNMVTDGVGGRQPRLRIIYDNGTESDHLLASFAKVLNADPDARRISFPDGAVGGLFEAGVSEIPVDGRIYVARTKSTETSLAKLAPHMLKIGRTGGNTARRIAGAASDATFLYAPVNVIATYAVRGFNVKDVERALHQFLADAGVQISIVDGMGRKVDPREWFMVTPEVVDQAVQIIVDRRLGQHRYDVKQNEIVAR